MAEGVYQRGKGTWSIVFDVGADPETGKRQQKWVTFKGTKKQAEQERTRLLRERDTGVLVADPATWTVAEYLKHWVDTYVVQNCGPKTEVGYRSIIKNRILPFVGGVQLAKLTPAHVRGLESTLLAKGWPADADAGGKYRIRPARPLSARGVEQTHRVLHEALAHAVKWQMIGRNVCDAVDPPRVQRKELQVWDAEEARRFFETVTAAKPDGGEAVPYGTALAFALLTGCRLGEVCGLRWSDADLDAGAVQIQHLR